MLSTTGLGMCMMLIIKYLRSTPYKDPISKTSERGWNISISVRLFVNSVQTAERIVVK